MPEIPIKITGHDNGAAAAIKNVASEGTKMGDALEKASGRARDANGRFIKGLGDASKGIKGVGDETDKTASKITRLERATQSLDQQFDAIGRNKSFSMAATEASHFNKVLDEARSRTEGLSKNFQQVRNFGAGLAVAGAGGLALSNQLIQVSEEGRGVEARLESILKQQGRMGDLGGIQSTVQNISTQGHFANDNEIRNAAVLMASYSVSTHDLGTMMELAARQARTMGLSVGEVSNQLAKAYGTGNVAALRRSGVLLTQQESAAVKAAYGISQANGQLAFMQVVTRAISDNTAQLSDSLTATQAAANDFAREMRHAMTNTGEGAADAKAEFQGLGADILEIANQSPGLERAAGAIGFIGSGALTATGGIIALAGQLGQAYVALMTLKAAREANAAAAEAATGADLIAAEAKGEAAIAAAADTEAEVANALAKGANAEAAGAEATAAGIAAEATSAESVALAANTEALVANAEAAMGAAAANYRYATSAGTAAAAATTAGAAEAGASTAATTGAVTAGAVDAGAGALAVDAGVTLGGVVSAIELWPVTAGIALGGAITSALGATGIVKDLPSNPLEQVHNAWARVSGGEVTQENGKTTSENSAEDAKKAAADSMKSAKADGDKAKADLDKMLKGVSGGTTASALPSVATTGATSDGDTADEISDLSDKITLSTDKGEKARMRVQMNHLKALERANKAGERERTKEAKTRARAYDKLHKAQIKQADSEADADADVQIEQLKADFEIRKAQIEASTMTDAQKKLATGQAESQEVSKEGDIRAAGMKGADAIGRQKTRQIAAIEAAKILKLAQIEAGNTKNTKSRSGRSIGEILSGSVFGGSTFGALSDMGGGSMFNPYSNAKYGDGAQAAFSSVGRDAGAAMAAERRYGAPDSAPFWYSNAPRIPKVKNSVSRLANGQVKLEFESIVLPLDSFLHALGGLQ